MKTNMKLLIKMNMGFTSKNKVDATQPSNTPTSRKKLPKAILRIIGVFP
jgi:hypothetical protein